MVPTEISPSVGIKAESGEEPGRFLLRLGRGGGGDGSEGDFSMDQLAEGMVVFHLVCVWCWFHAGVYLQVCGVAGVGMERDFSLDGVVGVSLINRLVGWILSVRGCKKASSRQPCVSNKPRGSLRRGMRPRGN